MRSMAWVLRADNQRGKAGEVVGTCSLRDPFLITVSSPAGEVDRLTVTGAEFNHLFPWSEITLPDGQIVVVAWQRPTEPNFLFVKGSTLTSQKVVKLTGPVTLVTPLEDAECTVTDRPAPPKDEADGDYVELAEEDLEKGPDFHEGSSRMKWRMLNGRMVETTDPRPVLRITADGGREVVTKNGAGNVSVSVEVLTAQGARDTSFSGAVPLEARPNYWINVAVTNGLGTFALRKSNNLGVSKISSSEAFRVEEPVKIIIAES